MSRSAHLFASANPDAEKRKRYAKIGPIKKINSVDIWNKTDVDVTLVISYAAFSANYAIRLALGDIDLGEYGRAYENAKPMKFTIEAGETEYNIDIEKGTEKLYLTVITKSDNNHPIVRRDNRLLNDVHKKSFITVEPIDVAAHGEENRDVHLAQ